MHLALAPDSVDWEEQDLPAELLEELKAQELAETIVCYVRWDNVTAYNLFRQADNAWRYYPMGGLAGLDMQQAKAQWDMLQLTYTPDNVRDVLTIANRIVSEMARKQNAK